MTTYLEEIVRELLLNKIPLEKTRFVVPSKRAVAFLKNELLKQLPNTVFSPDIFSIESFVEGIADLKIAGHTELLFLLYESYLKADIPEKDSFESFASWATVLLDDFNEIDRNLIDRGSFFNYLSEIKEIDHWYLNPEKTPLIQNYILFWQMLPQVYDHFTHATQKKGFAHQGLVYREAASNMEHYIQANTETSHVFIGFNALNMAEQTIFEELLENNTAKVYWDADAYFMKQQTHSASLFLRQYKASWRYFQENPFNHIADNFAQPKEIEIIGSSKQVGQAKYAAEILKNFSEEELQDTALILADENLLEPVLQSLPENVKAVNITMGLPLKNVPAYAFFESLLQVQQSASEAMYYKDILRVVEHEFGTRLCPKTSVVLRRHILSENVVEMSFHDIQEICDPTEKDRIALLFKPWNSQIPAIIDNCLLCLVTLKNTLGKQQNPLLLETLFKLYDVWSTLKNWEEKYPYIQSVKTLTQLFNELASASKIDFQGDAHQGLQIMGILETRALCFKTILMLSVNEGVLPAGKSNNSFITHDLKKQYQLPTFQEKDAVYAYHFYRLLHRAEKIFLLYNNHSSGIQVGEKSRFLLQMEFESPESHTISHKNIAPKIELTATKEKQIPKTPETLEILKNIAASGFSPSALSTYIRNPFEFYNRYILKIEEAQEVEETVAANTLGTVIHEALFELYLPFVHAKLTTEILQEIEAKSAAEVTKQFKRAYKGNKETGKNKIVYEMAKQYVRVFLWEEKKQVLAGNEIIIRGLETEQAIPLEIPELDFPTQIKGKVDRIDDYNGTRRIIDYKTGSVQQSELNLIDWEEITLDTKRSKAFQVLCYALTTPEVHYPLEAGIISFKNLSSGFLKFTKKETARGSGDTLINQETVRIFAEEVKKLIVEITSLNIPFTEKKPE